MMVNEDVHGGSSRFIMVNDAKNRGFQAVTDAQNGHIEDDNNDGNGLMTYRGSTDLAHQLTPSADGVRGNP